VQLQTTKRKDARKYLIKCANRGRANCPSTDLSGLKFWMLTDRFGSPGAECRRAIHLRTARKIQRCFKHKTGLA